MSIKTALFDGVFQIEIARPEKKNALTMAMYTALAEALVQARGDASVRAVLITGQPGIFTSGNDLEDFMAAPPRDENSPVFVFMRALLDCDKPVIAAVNGVAAGAGANFALCCDFVIAVGHEAGGQGDVLPGQALRVARAVPTARSETRCHRRRSRRRRAWGPRSGAGCARRAR